MRHEERNFRTPSSTFELVENSPVCSSPNIIPEEQNASNDLQCSENNIYQVQPSLNEVIAFQPTPNAAHIKLGAKGV